MVFSKGMSSKLLNSFVAIASTIIVLAMATTHLLCDAHEIHLNEWESASDTHIHALCECGICPCAVREVSIAAQWNSIDEVGFEHVASIMYSRYFDYSAPINYIRRLRIPPNDYKSLHLRFHRATVILI